MDYIPVDPATLSLQTLLEIYEVADTTSAGRTGKHKYVRAYGVESLVNTGVDIAPLLEHWDELRTQVAVISEGSEEDPPPFVRELQDVLGNIPDLLRHVLAGRMTAAAEILDTIGYGLMEVVSLSLSAHQDLTDQANRQGEVAEIMAEVLGDSDQSGLYREMAATVAQAVADGLEAMSSLRDYERELDEYADVLQTETSGWAARSNTTTLWLSEQLWWLLDTETGFVTRASRFLIKPDPQNAEAIQAAAEEAQSRLQTIRGRETQAQQTFDRTVEIAGQLLEQSVKISGWFRVLRESRQTIQHAEDRRITAFARAARILDPEDYQRWQILAADREWASPHQALQRLEDKIAVLRGFLGARPKLDESTVRRLREAQTYVERILALPSVKPAGSKPTPTPRPTATPSQPTPAGESDPRRLAELYEQMLAVGAVKYCRGAYLTGGTPNAMLDALEILGRLTSAERELYREALEQRLEADSLLLDQGHARLAVWHTTDPAEAHWLKFFQGRGRSKEKYPMWRLVSQAYPAGISLGVKHKLRPEDIKRAFEQRRAPKSGNKPRTRRS